MVNACRYATYVLPPTFRRHSSHEGLVPSLRPENPRLLPFLRQQHFPHLCCSRGLQHGLVACRQSLMLPLSLPLPTDARMYCGADQKVGLSLSLSHDSLPSTNPMFTPPANQVYLGAVEGAVSRVVVYYIPACRARISPVWPT